MLQRGSGRLREVTRPVPHGVDIDGLLGWAAALADDLTGGTTISPQRLHPALTTPPPVRN
jgi:hypothetical protein